MSERTGSGLPLILIGAGGHARVLHALALAADQRVIGLCDPDLAARRETHWFGVPVLGGDEALADMDPTSVGLINGIGQIVGSQGRQRIYEHMRSGGFRFPPLIHPTAWVAPDLTLRDGVQIMAGCIVQPGCRIGEGTIINTRASVDHDCIIGANVHIAPGATLCGGVQVADGAFIGAGAILIQGLHVGMGSVVGAGATLIHDMLPGQTVRGAGSRLNPEYLKTRTKLA